MRIPPNQENSKITTIHSLIFIVYILIIFEGALRKWTLPQLSSPLFFSKDPFVLYIYYICLRYKLFPQNKLAVFSYCLSFSFLVLGLVQTLVSPFPFFVVLYGWRSYFMFMPLSFIIAEYCDFNFIKKIAKFTCYIAIPIAVLTFIQYKSPATAIINKNVGGSTTEVFTVARGIVRTSGTFSFTNGQAFFISSLLAMLLLNFFLGSKQNFLPEWISYVSFIAFFSNLAVSGSRTTYGNSLIIVIFLIASSIILINKKRSASILLLTVVGGLVAIVLFSTVFSDQLELMSERQELAKSAEGSIFNRIAGFFFVSDEDMPFLGYGLGLGSVGGTYLATGTNAFGLAETEWARIELENGYIFGLIYIVYRLYLTYLIINNAFKATIRTGNPIPVIITGFIFHTIALGQMTMNGTTLFYGWFFLGFAMAVNRIFLNKEYEEETKLQVIAT